jgi:hypothetical protein
MASADPLEGVPTPEVAVTDELVADLVRHGGYTHPLFNPEPGGRATPLPGQGVLLLMGGLVEQSGLLDDAVALVELRSVRFLAMVTSGATVGVRISELERTTTASGKTLQVFRWTAVTDEDVVVAEAEAVMLMSRPAEVGA